MAAGRNSQSKSPRGEPWYRLEYEKTLRRVLRDAPARSAKFKIFELVGAFLTMRRREAGIDARNNRLEAHTFEVKTVEGLRHWVPGKDKVIDGVQEALHKLGKTKPEVREILEQISSHLKNQTRKAKSPRKAKLFNRYLDEILKTRPNITEPELIQQIEKDEGGGIISHVFSHQIELDDVNTGELETVKITTIRNRLHRRKILFKKSLSLSG